MLNSTFNPSSLQELNSNNCQFASQGISATITAGSTTNIDLALTDDTILVGLGYLTSGAANGDYVTFQIVDVLGTYGTAGTVISQPITNWYISDTFQSNFMGVFPAKVLGGLTLRIIYTSTGTANVFVGINHRLLKVLI